MKNFLRSNLAKCLLAFLLIIGGTSILIFTPGAFFVPSCLDAVLVPMQQVINKITGNAVDVLPGSEKTAQEYEEEISKLKGEVRRMRTVLIDYYNVKRENAQYLKFYDFKKQNKSLNFMPALVVSRDPNDIFYGFTLDKGKNDGVCVNDAVITQNGLIGRVATVTANSCTVKTVLSSDVKFGVVTKESNDSGVISGNAKLAADGLTGMMYLSAQNNIEIDNLVVTTGLGGVCPKDLPIGKIKEISHDDFDSSFFAVVEPLDDIKTVMDVFIVTKFEGKGDIVISRPVPKK